jgi:hypothetical protein
MALALIRRAVDPINRLFPRKCKMNISQGLLPFQLIQDSLDILFPFFYIYLVKQVLMASKRSGIFIFPAHSRDHQYCGQCGKINWQEDRTCIGSSHRDLNPMSDEYGKGLQKV